MRRLIHLALAAVLATSLLVPLGVLADDSLKGVDTSALSQPSVEVREVVPFGKENARFGLTTKVPDGIAVPPSTPIQVRLLATKAPRVNEAINVALEVYAARDVSNIMAEIQVPKGAAVLQGLTKTPLALRGGEKTTVTAAIVFPAAGEYTIRGVALAPIDKDTVWGDEDDLFFTVGAQSGTAGLASAGGNTLSSGQFSAESKPPAGAEGDLSEEEKPELVTPEANVTISICWILGSDRDGSTPPLNDAQLILFDDDAGADDQLWSGYTNYYNGCKSVTVSNVDADEGGTIDVYWKVKLDHTGRYRVRTYGGAIYNGTTSVVNNVAANVNYGTWWMGGGAGNDRSVRIWNDLYRLRRFITEQGNAVGMGGDPGAITVRWETGGGDGTYYSLGDGLVHLMDADAASRDTVVHEASHRIMHVVYAGWTAGSDCPSPHFIDGVSGKYCAWSEGYTYVHVAAADGNPVYTWPSGSTLNLETPNCATAGWADGGRVEGRVGGVLIDLLDPFTISFGSVAGFSNEPYVAACGGSDEVSGMYQGFWDLFFDQNDDVFVTLDGVVNSFSNAWESRQYPRYGPAEIGDLNSISTFGHD